MLAEILRANTFLVVTFIAALIFGAYSWWDQGRNQDPQIVEDYNSNLGYQLSNQNTTRETNGSDYIDRDSRGIGSIGGGGEDGEINQAVFETNPPLLEGYVAGYGTKTSGSREYWVLLVATPQLEINGYEVDLRDIIGYRKVDTDRWQEGELVRIYGTLESETVVRARAVQ